MSSQEFELDCSQQGPAQVRTVLPQRRLGRFLFFQHKWPCLGVSAAAGTLIIVLLLAGLSAPAPAPSSLVPPSHSTPLAIQSSSTNLTQAIESPYHSSSHTESTTSSATAAAAATPATNFMNTRPPLPQLIPRPAAPNERFLSYLPHSGFHNQRIALTNAILLANMLNRTLLVPPARLGQAQGWKDKKTLQKILQTDQKTPNKVQECLDDQGLFKVQHTQHSQFCKTYDEYIGLSLVPCTSLEKRTDEASHSEVSWSMLIDVQHTNSQVPLVSRSDISQNWLTSKDGLNIPEDSVSLGFA